MSDGVVYRSMQNFFESDEWHPSQVEDQSTLRMGFQGEWLMGLLRAGTRGA